MRISLDRVFASAALAISLGTASITYMQYRSQKHDTQLAIQPRLAITPYLEGPGGRNGLYVSNDGAGTAHITAMRLAFEGRTFEGPGASPWPVIARAMGASGCFHSGWPIGDATFLRAGQTEVLVAPTREREPQCAGAIVRLLAQGHLAYTVHYTDLDGHPFDLHDTVEINDSEVVQRSLGLSAAPPP
jgi:hypothetical protein